MEESIDPYECPSRLNAPLLALSQNLTKHGPFSKAAIAFLQVHKQFMALK
jgi:hypothetical protein